MNVTPRADRRAAKAELHLTNLKHLVHQAKEHISHEFVRTDGIAASTTLAASSWIDADGKVHTVGGGGSRSADSTSPTERTVIARAHLLENMYQINDDLDTILTIIKSLEKTCRQVIGTRVPIPIPRCNANPGWDGYKVTLADGGWHDALCTGIARSNANYSICDACRKRLSRWRDRNGQKELSDDRIVKFDSVAVTGDDGVAHVKPLGWAS